MVESIRTGSEDILRRLELLENRVTRGDRSTKSKYSEQRDADDQSMPTLRKIKTSETSLVEDHTVGSVHITTSVLEDQPDENTFSSFDSNLASGSDEKHIGTELELLLQGSRAYSRGFKTNSRVSEPFSNNHTARWSSISGISLSQVTNISVLSLPISVHELWNQQYWQPALERQLNSHGIAEKKTESSLMRKQKGKQITWIRQKWSGATAKSRERHPDSQFADQVRGYNLAIPRHVLNAQSPYVKLLLAGKFSFAGRMS